MRDEFGRECVDPLPRLGRDRVVRVEVAEFGTGAGELQTDLVGSGDVHLVHDEHLRRFRLGHQIGDESVPWPNLRVRFDEQAHNVDLAEGGHRPLVAALAEQGARPVDSWRVQEHQL